MGYRTRYNGEIAISPPIPWGLVKDSVFANQGYDTPRSDERDVKFRITEETVETDEGTLIRRQAVAIVPSREDEPRDNGTEHHVQEIIGQFGDARTFTGRIDAEGEEAGDIWRVEIRDGQAVRVGVRLVWPEDDIPTAEEAAAMRAELAALRVRAKTADERLALCKSALLEDGYFRPDQVGPDIAPRITERLIALRKEIAELRQRWDDMNQDAMEVEARG